MTANLPVVHPAKLLFAPVLLVRDMTASPPSPTSRVLLNLLPNGDRQSRYPSGTPHSLGSPCHQPPFSARGPGMFHHAAPIATDIAGELLI